MSNQIIQDHTHKIFAAKYELEKIQCKAIKFAN